MGNVQQIADRRQLAKESGVKLTRWPRTDRRRSRVEGVLARRQPDLTVVLEDVHDPHNVSAVFRSCDAVGVMEVHLVYELEEPPAAAFARTTSASAAKWIDTRWHASITDCYEELLQRGLRILAMMMAEESADLYAVDLIQPVALVFGNENRGVSSNAVSRSDGQVSIPMVGMVQSLNVSVACAVTLYEAFRQRRAAGHYASQRINDDRLQSMRDDWLKR